MDSTAKRQRPMCLTFHDVMPNVSECDETDSLGFGAQVRRGAGKLLDPPDGFRVRPGKSSRSVARWSAQDDRRRQVARFAGRETEGPPERPDEGGITAELARKRYVEDAPRSERRGDQHCEGALQATLLYICCGCDRPEHAVQVRARQPKSGTQPVDIKGVGTELLFDVALNLDRQRPP